MDANILLYAEDTLSRHHQKARNWWDEQLSGEETIGLSWTVLSAFIRIGTNSRVYETPLSLEAAISRVQSWMEQPCTREIRTTPDHWIVFQEMLLVSKATGNLVTDAHLAALAIEHGATMASTDSDFARFPRLKWFNPLAI